MFQQIKWKLTRSLYSIIGRDPPTRPQAEVAPRPRPTIHFLGDDWGRAELIKWVALCTLPTLAIIFCFWFLSRTSEQTQMKFWSIVVLLIVIFVSLMVVVLILYWWYGTDRRILPAIGLGLLLTFYAYMLAAAAFFVVDEFFATNFGRSWQDFKIPQPLQEPITATLGAIFLLASLFTLWIIVTTKDSWAERADKFKAFLAFFLAGISILATSKVLDPLLGTSLGNSLRSHFGHWGQHAKLIVDLGAIALATIAILFLPSKRD
jgi:cytochrome bd-type quinol oxidase subunit 2